MNKKQMITESLPAISKMLTAQKKLTLAHDIETAIEMFNEQRISTNDTLRDIMRALQSNPHCSQQMLFECCANAFAIAEKAMDTETYTHQEADTIRETPHPTIVVDPKGCTRLLEKTMRACVSAGRRDDLHILNYMVPTDDKQ
jgi:hypothetical protein